jgi:hypothetical protein
MSATLGEPTEHKPNSGFGRRFLRTSHMTTKMEVTSKHPAMTPPTIAPTGRLRREVVPIVGEPDADGEPLVAPGLPALWVALASADPKFGLS